MVIALRLMWPPDGSSIDTHRWTRRSDMGESAEVRFGGYRRSSCGVGSLSAQDRRCPVVGGVRVLSGGGDRPDVVDDDRVVSRAVPVSTVCRCSSQRQ